MGEVAGGWRPEAALLSSLAMLCRRWSTPVLVLLVVVTIAPPAMARRLGAPLALMLAIRERGDQRPEWDWVLPGIASDEVGLSVRLRVAPDRDLEARIRATGADFRRDDRGRPWHIGPIYSVLAPWAAVRPLADVPEIERIELARPPGLVPHLDVSGPEIGAPEAWARRDSLGRPLDGTGVVAADFDSGIDVFHPLFFRADGGVFDWLDVDADGRFEPGTDAVDLDGDGLAGPGEALGLLEGTLGSGVGAGWADGRYDADVDWLYNDANDDGVRSYGPAAGYTDLDPSFGERLFIVADTDGDAVLDPGEALIGLGTSKLLATLLWPDVIRYRGVDLIETPVVDPAWERYTGAADDRADHGTGVASVLGGGWSDSGRRITGIAPGVELILVDFNNDLGLAATLPWAISLGAHVSSHPYGHKAFAFLDGSSNDELAIDLAWAEDDALQVVSVGNEAQNRNDATAVVPGEGVLSVPFEVQHYDWQSVPVGLVALTVRWRRPDVRLSFRLVDAEGTAVSLGGSGGTVSLGEAQVDASREDSPRGTAKFDLVVTSGSGLEPGGWSLEVTSIDDEPTPLWATIINDVFRGGMGAVFTDETQVDQMSTVSAYATADRAVGACSYGTRQSWAGEVLGDISGFSSRGPRIDGVRIVDICAPGDNDIIWAQAARGQAVLGGYSFGGGTSASAPHVAGAIAVLQQAAPWATAQEIEDALYDGALVDAFVGPEVPDHVWGAGKLRVACALDLLPPAPEPPRDDPDLAPWEGDLTPDAGLPHAPAAVEPLVGVEGGGCHCDAGARRGSAGALVAVLGALWR